MQARLYPNVLVKYDHQTEMPVRGPDGFCSKVDCGEPGLLLSQIKGQFVFDGYRGNEALNEKKLLKNVFRKGDRFFNTGDVLVLDKDYFLYFNDRIGDTFR